MSENEDLYDQLSEMELTLKARRHYSETDSYAAYWANRYRRWHHFYAPLNGDQWPEDRQARPGMIHLTHNIIAPAVDTESRIESRLPRATLVPDNVDEQERARAEKAEKLQLRWLELSGWKRWMNDAAKTKSIYGKVVLKPFWRKGDKRPDVSIIESPQNLRLGWGASDYSELDWALYEYALSPYQAMSKFPEIEIRPKKGSKKDLEVIRHGDHGDPLQQKAPTSQLGPFRLRLDVQESDYEGKHVKVWDYWCKIVDEKGEEHIVNAFFVDGVLASKPAYHDYLPDIPYIVIEHDHEPGSPEGIGDVEPLIDVQIELNRALSHWAQLVADEIDPAYQVDAESVPGGLIPRNGEVVAAGEGKQVRPIEKGINVFPIQELIEALMKAFHFRSGLSEIMFSLPPGAQTAGRALAIQIEASANRIDPRRDRLYGGLEELLIFWAHMAEHINPQIHVGFDEAGQAVQKGVREILQGFRRWKFVAPEITPRDNLELVTSVVNRLNNKLISLEDAMDELGVDSPLEMIQKIEAERMNPRLFPGDTQSFVAVLAMLQQYQMTAQQAGLMPGGGDPAAAAQGQLQAEAQERAPQGIQGQNGSDVPQPATPAGGAPPPGAAAPQNQTLIRPTPSGGTQALQQIKVTSG
jgi:hypothetical protein